MTAFKGSFLKLKRAKRHIDELESEFARYRSEMPARISDIRIETTDEGDTKSISAEGKVRFSPQPEMTPAILGDIFHNLRSSLDLMASELAKANGNDPSKVYFPFSKDAAGLDEQIKNKSFHLCGPDAVALVKTVQPFKSGNPKLRAIHDLDVMDKHQEILPHPRPKTEFLFLAFEPHKDGTALVPRMSEKPEVTLIFPKDTGLDGLEVIQALKSLVELCESLLESFALLHPGYKAGS